MAVRFVLGVLCAYHLGVGLLGCLSAEATVQFGAWFYGLEIDASAAQFAYMLKALSMYALFTGALAAVALHDPERHRSLLWALAGLLVMRCTTRLLFFGTLHQAFHVGWARNLFHVGLMALKAAVLLWGTAPAARAEPRTLAAARRALASASNRLAPVRVPARAFASASGVR
ncbi:MAG: hypothetical protein D6731_11455 [Planctomycetota bacterium]|nr:MAG: hypothetical protein D6731_11455 [Planctomycetota bacterium]